MKWAWILSEEGCVRGPFLYGIQRQRVLRHTEKRSPMKNFPQMTRQCVLRHTEKNLPRKISRKWPHCLANGVHVIGVCFTDDTKRKHPMSICVFKKVIYFSWYDNPFCLFPIISRSVYPWPHWFFRYPASNKHETCPSLHGWVIGRGIPITCLSLHWWRQRKRTCSCMHE